MKKGKMKLWKKILLILVIMILILILTFISYRMYLKISNDIEINRRYNEFEKIQAIETKGKLTYIESTNYSKVEGMDYVMQDGIGAKVDSIVLNDDTFSANINFKLDKDINYETLSYGYAVYDENNNIYQVSSRQHMGNLEKMDYDSISMLRELGSYNKNDIYSVELSDSSGIVNEDINKEEKTVVSKITIDARDKFPLSQKIYIKIFDLGYFTIDKNENGEYDTSTTKNIDLSSSKWLFELDIPEEMNKRDTINLKLANEIPELEIKSMTLTDTKLVINFISEEYINLISEGKDMPTEEFRDKRDETLRITDGEGKVYQELSGGTRGKNTYKMVLDANKNDLAKKLYINYKIGDKQYKSELIKDE